jgi:hypothetical protein
LLYWDVEFPMGSEERPIRTSQALINEATYVVNVGNEVNTRKTAATEGIFLGTDNETENGAGMAGETFAIDAYQNGDGEVNFNSFASDQYQTISSVNADGAQLLGKIHHIDHASGHGYLHGINNVYDNLIFFRNQRNTDDFNELEKYDIVMFEVAQNAKGDYATNVRYSASQEPEEAV